MLRVAICGDGPIALSVAAVCGWRGHLVRVLSEAPHHWRECLTGRLPDGERFAGPLEPITKVPRKAIERANVVFVCVRHYQTEEMLRRIAPYLAPDCLVGAIPGFGGFGFLARRIMPAVTSFFGMQRIPFVVGGHVPGRSVYISGIRRQTFVGTMPANRAPVVAELIKQLLGLRSGTRLTIVVQSLRHLALRLVRKFVER
jgi:ketopantoate reductase